MKQGIVTLGSLNEMFEIYDKFYLTDEELYNLKIKHVLIKGDNLIRFTILVDKDQAIDLINENYTSIITEKIEGYEGIYGFFGASKALVSNIRPENQKEDSLVMYLDYEGPYWSVNSGPYKGMVIITSNFRNIKFVNIMT